MVHWCIYSVSSPCNGLSPKGSITESTGLLLHGMNLATVLVFPVVMVLCVTSLTPGTHTHYTHAHTHTHTHTHTRTPHTHTLYLVLFLRLRVCGSPRSVCACLCVSSGGGAVPRCLHHPVHEDVFVQRHQQVVQGGQTGQSPNTEALKLL